MEQNSLYNRPDLYDLMAPRDQALERFYVEMACEQGGRVLDLACGTGRLAVPLAQAGLHVTGGDISADMLQRARRCAEAQAIELDFVQLDMRDFDLNGRTFDTIIVAINSIQHLHSLNDFESFFKERAGKLVGGPRVYQSTIEAVKSCAEVKKTQTPSVIRFFRRAS